MTRRDFLKWLLTALAAIPLLRWLKPTPKWITLSNGWKYYPLSEEEIKNSKPLTLNPPYVTFDVDDGEWGEGERLKVVDYDGNTPIVEYNPQYLINNAINNELTKLSDI